MGIFQLFIFFVKNAILDSFRYEAYKLLRKLYIHKLCVKSTSVSFRCLQEAQICVLEGIVEGLRIVPPATWRKAILLAA